MQLSPAVRACLAGGPAVAEPLPVVRDPAAGAAPFRFAARLVRFPREHEFFEDGDVQRHLYLRDVLTQVAEVPERPRVPEFTCQVAGCRQAFDTLEGYEHHYHVLHRNVCSFCRRVFPSGHLLDSHILEWHDALFQILAERQDMYKCLVEGCEEKFKTSQDRKDHLVKGHLYPADFRFDKPRKTRGPATPGAMVPMSAEAMGRCGEQLEEADAMEVSCDGHAAPSPMPGTESRAAARLPGTRAYSHRRLKARVLRPRRLHRGSRESMPTAVAGHPPGPSPRASVGLHPTVWRVPLGWRAEDGGGLAQGKVLIDGCGGR